MRGAFSCGVPGSSIAASNAVREPAPGLVTPATIGSSSGEPGTCAQVVMRAATRSWICARVNPATGFATLVTRQMPVRAIGVNTSPAGSPAMSGRAVSPMSDIPRETSAIPVAERPPTSSKRGGDRTARR